MKSVIEPVGTGTRSDVPSSLPFIDSSTRLRGAGGAGAGRHDVDRRAAGPAQIAVRAVDELLVAGVGVHRRHQALLDTPNASSSTLTIGTKQLVVQLAFEMTLCFLKSKSCG